MRRRLRAGQRDSRERPGPSPGAPIFRRVFAAATALALALSLFTPVSAAKPAAPTVARADLRPAAPQRAGRSFLRPRTAVPPTAERAATVAPSRAVRHRVKTAAKIPKAVATPRPRKPRTPGPAVTYSVPASGAVAVVVAWALAQVGKPYVWGTAGPRTFDCSGLLLASFARVGIRLPHQSGAIAARARPVPAGQWRPGDVLTWPGHIALYLGGGKMVEAANPRAGVRVASIQGRGGTARRIIG